MEAVLKDVGNLLTHVPLATILYVIVLTLCIKYVMDLFRRNPRHVEFAKTLPGPPDSPFFGNGYHFIDSSEDSLKMLAKYEEKYGSMYRLWFGKHLVITTTNIEFVETIFRSTKTLDKPTVMLDAGGAIWGEESVFNAKTHLWKKSRKELQTFFTKNSISEKLPQINYLIRKYVGVLEKHVDGPAFNVGPIMDVLSFEVIVEVLLNSSLECPDKDVVMLSECFRDGDAMMFQKIFKPWLCNAIFDFIFFRKRMQKFKATLDNFFKKVLDGQITSPKSELETTETSFIQLLHRLTETLGLAENYVQDETILMIAAGNLTTATTASYCLLTLAMYPEIQEKVYAEIIEVLGPEDRDPDINEMNNLTYLEQVLKETERLFLLVPLIFRFVKEDIEHGPHKIPAGTSVMIATHAIHHSPKYYKDPKKFDPEHFSAEEVGERPKLAFFPFSSGARNCLGKSLAELELRLIVINFLRHFKFSTTNNLNELKLVFSFVSHLEEGYLVKIRRRQGHNGDV